MSITRLDLELYLLDELDAARLAVVQQALDTDADLAERLNRLRTQVDIVVPAFVPPAPQVPEPANRPWRWVVGLAVAAAVGLVTVVSLAPNSPEDPGMVYRGALELDARIVREGVILDVGSVVQTRRGDLLQWRVLTNTDGHLTVIDQQDDGVWAVWESTPLTAGESVEGTVVLDGYPGAERVWFVATETAIEVSDHILPIGADVVHTDTLDVGGTQRTLLLSGSE